MEAEIQSALVRVQGRDFWCEGQVVMPTPGSYKGRLLDLLNSGTGFLALTDVLLHKAGQEAAEDPVHYDVILLRKGEIEFVIPLD